MMDDRIADYLDGLDTLAALDDLRPAAPRAHLPITCSLLNQEITMFNKAVKTESKLRMAIAGRPVEITYEKEMRR